MTIREVRVLSMFDAPLEQVFDAVSDHESFICSGGTSATVVRPGKHDRNGLGCLREVRTRWHVHLLEEVIAWRRPSAYEYRIRESSIPLRHHGGRVAFASVGGGTEVEWTSRFEIPTPVVGPLLGWLTKRLLARAFAQMLGAAKARLEAGR